MLFVIDDTGSMGAAQGKLADGIGVFVDALDAARIDYRIGITTTDNGNPWCPSGAESGALVARSCRGHLGDFLLGVGDPTDVGDIACTDHCALEPDQLEALMQASPSGTVDDDVERVRPWIESSSGWTNLPEGVTPTQALECFLPQGVVGCSFESQLASMALAFARADDDEDEAWGFLRRGAGLAVVFLTDEADCSYNPLVEEAFTSSNVLWSDPDAVNPTSALCWNAGVACTGGPGSYDECHAADVAVDGTPAYGELDAVLRPLDRYIDTVRSTWNAKLVDDPRQAPVIAAIVGVPEGYTTADLGQLYADASDPVFQADFGIGPGCAQGEAEAWHDAVPPVRIRELSEAFSDDALSSICADDYRPALASIAARIADQMSPACFRGCARDADADADGLQPDCFIEQQDPFGSGGAVVPECAQEQGAYVMPADDVDVCFVSVTDPELMSAGCVDDGFNLEFRVLRREGVPAPPGSGVYAQCTESEAPTIDCPGLAH